MINHEEWNELINDLFIRALKYYQTTKEYKFLQEKREQIDSQIFKIYPEDKNTLLYDLVFEIGLDAERKAEFVYRQGIKDCVFMLKELGVLA